jgi:hypothetical protein
LTRSTRRSPRVEKIEATPDHLFLFTEAQQAYAVPRRAFRDDG